MALELQTIENNTAQTLPVLIRDGIKGNMQVLFEMMRIIQKSVYKDLALKALAADILLYNNLDSTSDITRIFEMLFNFVAKQNSVIIKYQDKKPVYNSRNNNSKKYVAFIQDVAGNVENIKDARRTLSDGFGDCDDHTILNASLLGCLGYENIKLAVAKYNNLDETFSHVYCVVYENNKRYVFDTTLPDARLNKEVKATEIKEISIFDNANTLSGFSSVYYGASRQIKKLGKAATEIIPQVTAFLPLGFLAGTSLATSAELVNMTKGANVSVNTVASRINLKLNNIVVDLMKSNIAYDLAKTYALQVSAQLSAIENINVTDKQYKQIKACIKDRLDFILNFPAFAKKHNIKLVNLDARFILLSFLGIAGFTSYTIYKNYNKG